MHYYVYTLARPDGVVFYVGKGKGKRVADHEKEALRGHNCPKCELIRSIWQQGGIVQRAIVFETDDERAALDREAELIRELGQDRLMNRVPGGRGYARGPRRPKNKDQARLYAQKLNALFTAILPPNSKKEYTLEQVAEALRQQGTPVSLGQIGKLRRGDVDDPGMSTLQALSDFFGVDIAYWTSPATALTPATMQASQIARIQRLLAQRTYTPDQLQFIEMMLASLRCADPAADHDAPAS